MTDKKTELPCKFVLLGQAAVGKSSVVLRFVEGKFRDYNESTSGASYFNKVIKLKDNSQLSLSVKYIIKLIPLDMGYSRSRKI